MRRREIPIGIQREAFCLHSSFQISLCSSVSCMFRMRSRTSEHKADYTSIKRPIFTYSGNGLHNNKNTFSVENTWATHIPIRDVERWKKKEVHEEYSRFGKTVLLCEKYIRDSNGDFVPGTSFFTMNDNANGEFLSSQINHSHFGITKSRAIWKKRNIPQHITLGKAPKTMFCACFYSRNTSYRQR